MLGDLCPERKAEINVITAAQADGVPARLRQAAGMGTLAVAAEQSVDQLKRERGMRDDAARWAVTTWSAALGLAGPVPPPRSSPPSPPSPQPPATPSPLPRQPSSPPSPPRQRSSIRPPMMNPDTVSAPGLTNSGGKEESDGVGDGANAAGPPRNRWLAWSIPILSVAALVICGLVLAVFVSEMWNVGGWTRFWAGAIAAVAIVLWLAGALVVGQEKGPLWGVMAVLLGVAVFPAYTFLESRGGRSRKGAPLQTVPMTALVVLWTLICIIPYNVAR
ncbi:MAG: hypothetical protein ACKOWF_12485 [Chloroflexota bacterium]